MKTLSGSIALLSAALLTTTAACGGDTPRAAGDSPTPESGPLVVTTDEVRFTVPSDWRTLDPDVGDSALASAAEDVGVTPQMLEKQLEAVDVMVAAPSPDKGFLDNVNVSRTPLPLASLAQVENQYAMLGVDQLDVREVETPVGQAYASSYLMTTPVAAVHGAALTFAGARDVVTITISTDQRDETHALAKQVLASVESAS